MSKIRFALCVAVALSTACKQSDPEATPTPVATKKPVVAVAAPPPSDASIAADSRDFLPHPILFSATKNGKTAYFFGTVHLGVDIEKRLPPWVWQRFINAQTFAMETNLQDPSLISSVMRTDGTTLHAELGDDYWKKFVAAVGEQMANGVNSMKLSTASSLIEIQGLPMTAPMDLVFANKAQESKKQIVFLEEARSQEALLDKWLDVRSLKQSLDNLDEVRKKNGELLTNYVNGDVEAIAKMSDDRDDWHAMKRSDKEFDQMMDELLYQRNAAWIPALEKIIDSGSGFVAVGAMHLSGPRSVLDLLAQRGYTVARVTGP